MPTNNLLKIVIFGRTNVGKSTLFNRLIEENRALTADEEGTTRDSNFGRVEWGGVEFEIIDTGGIINLRELTVPLSGQKKKLAAKKMKLAPDKETIDKKVQLQVVVAVPVQQKEAGEIGSQCQPADDPHCPAPGSRASDAG